MPANSLMLLLRNITGLRKHYGCSKKQMAHLLGIGIGTLNKIEAGIIPPRLTVEIVFIISREFHIEPSVLFSVDLFPNQQRDRNTFGVNWVRS